MTEEFWKSEKAKEEANPFETNKIWKQTKKDVESIRSPKHPKELYIECLRNSSYWHHYAASPKLTVEDLAMILCKDVGCNLTYCQMIKGSYTSDWEGSSDCTNENAVF